MSVDSASTFNNTISELANEYDTPLQKIRVMTKDEFAYKNSSFAFVSHDYSVDSAELVINPVKCGDVEKLNARIKELSQKGYCANIADDVAGKYVATHEFAHTLLNIEQPLNNSRNWLNADYGKIRNARKEINVVYKEYMDEVQRLTTIKKKHELEFLETASESAWAKTHEFTKALKEVKISNYSLESVDEFMAEAFVNEKIGISSNKYAKEVVEILNKYFKR